MELEARRSVTDLELLRAFVDRLNIDKAPPSRLIPLRFEYTDEDVDGRRTVLSIGGGEGNAGAWVEFHFDSGGKYTWHAVKD